jgi:prephenate dehydratase
MTKVAFQGIAGAYSEQAIRQYFGPDAESLACRTFDDVFALVEHGDAEFGMLPVENSVAGSVTRAY